MGLRRVLVVDEDENTHALVREAVVSRKGTLHRAASPAAALDLLHDTTFDLIIAAATLPGLSGLDLLQKVRQSFPSIPVVLTTAYPAVEEAVEAMRIGALDYLTKPLCSQKLGTLLDQIAAEHKAAHSGSTCPPIIAVSSEMQRVLEQINRAALTNATVCLTGESGTGKEVVARALHAYSERRDRPYVCVNCAAVPDTLIESEFFGHEKGAFTGAHARKSGRFESAEGGTLLLDEVSEIPLILQPKLLRVIQEREFERVGGMRKVKVDVRLVATSNRDLEEAVRRGAFREDLYYRLNVIRIHLPPLRDRPDDILPLAHHFLGPNRHLSPEAAAALLAHPWPGNVRELANVLERSALLIDGSTIHTVQF